MRKSYLSLENQDFLKNLILLYGSEQEVLQRNLHRYQHLENKFLKLFGEIENGIRFFSAPGRTEIAGNHTDHQLGNVIAGSVDLDVIAACSVRDDNKIQLYSEGYNKFETIDLNDLEVKAEEYGKTTALIRGVARRLKDLGYKIAGFNCYSTSEVPAGSGLSSSAAFEILIVTIFNFLFNQGKIDPVEQAKIGQYAENVYFDKPSGLLDQSASAYGNVISIDFADKENPEIKQLNLDLSDYGYEMVISRIDRGHSNLTHEYAAVTEEMHEVSEYFGKEVLSQVEPEEFFNNIQKLRLQMDDRAILRAIHFFTEDARVKAQVKAIEDKDFSALLELINNSGRSSEVQLQNVFLPGNTKDQSGELALAISRHFLDLHNLQGACRIHGGGFGGTIQAYIPKEAVADYIAEIEKVFGENSCSVIKIRPVGGIEL